MSVFGRSISGGGALDHSHRFAFGGARPSVRLNEGPPGYVRDFRLAADGEKSTWDMRHVNLLLFLAAWWADAVTGFLPACRLRPAIPSGDGWIVIGWVRQMFFRVRISF